MIRKTLPFMILFVIIIASVIGVYIYRNVQGFDIEIINNTDVDISGLNITYDKITQDVQVPTIKKRKKYNLSINPMEEFGENSMILYYTDKHGNVQKNVLIGYFEKGYNGRIKVTINEVYENGVIIMRIQEDLFI